MNLKMCPVLVFTLMALLSAKGQCQTLVESLLSDNVGIWRKAAATLAYRGKIILKDLDEALQEVDNIELKKERIRLVLKIAMLHNVKPKDLNGFGRLEEAVRDEFLEAEQSATEFAGQGAVVENNAHQKKIRDLAGFMVPSVLRLMESSAPVDRAYGVIIANWIPAPIVREKVRTLLGDTSKVLLIGSDFRQMTTVSNFARDSIERGQLSEFGKNSAMIFESLVFGWYGKYSAFDARLLNGLRGQTRAFEQTSWESWWKESDKMWPQWWEFLKSNANPDQETISNFFWSFEGFRMKRQTVEGKSIFEVKTNSDSQVYIQLKNMRTGKNEIVASGSRTAKYEVNADLQNRFLVSVFVNFIGTNNQFWTKEGFVFPLNERIEIEVFDPI